MTSSVRKSFFDTSITVYAASDNDAKGVVARDLLIAAKGTISVQVLNEFISVGRSKLKWPRDKIQEALTGVRELCEPVMPLTVEMHDLAMHIAARYQYHIYDSMILAAAIKAGCDVVYSEDMHHGQNIEGLTIRNPFVQ